MIVHNMANKFFNSLLIHLLLSINLYCGWGHRPRINSGSVKARVYKVAISFHIGKSFPYDSAFSQIALVGDQEEQLFLQYTQTLLYKVGPIEHAMEIVYSRLMCKANS